MQESTASIISSEPKLSQLQHTLAELDNKLNHGFLFTDFFDPSTIVNAEVDEPEAIRRLKTFIKRNEKMIEVDPDFRYFVESLANYRLIAMQVRVLQENDPLDLAEKIYHVLKDNYKAMLILMETATKIFNKYEHKDLMVRRFYDLPSVTAAPFQALMRYPLMLKEIIKNSTPGQPEHAKATALHAKFAALANETNEFRRTLEKSEALQNLHGGTLTKLRGLESFRDLVSSQGPSPSTARLNEQLLKIRDEWREYLSAPKKSFHTTKKEALIQNTMNLFNDFNAKLVAKRNKQAGNRLSEDEKEDKELLEKNLAILADFLLPELKEEFRLYRANPKKYPNLQKEELVKRNAALYSYFTFKLNMLINKSAEKALNSFEIQEKQNFEYALPELREYQQILMKDVATERKSKRLSATLSSYAPAKKGNAIDANLTEIQAAYKNKVTRVVSDALAQTNNDQNIEVRFYQQESLAQDMTIQLVRSLSRVAHTLIERNFVGLAQQERLAELNEVTRQYIERIKKLQPNEVTQARYAVGELTQVLFTLSFQKPDASEFRKLLKEQTYNESNSALVNVWDDVKSAHLPYSNTDKSAAIEAHMVENNVSIAAYIPNISAKDKAENESQQLKTNYSHTKTALASLAQSVVPLQQVQDGQTIRLKLNINKLRMPEVDQNLSLTTRILNWFGIDAAGERKRNETQQFILKALNGEVITIHLPDGKGKANVKLNITQTAAPESAMHESTPTRLLKLVGFVPNEILIDAADMRKYFNQQDKGLNIWINNTQIELSLRESIREYLVASQLSVASQNALKDKRRELTQYYRQSRGLVESNDAIVDEVKAVILQKERELAELHKKANEETREKLETIDIKALREQINKALRTGQFDNVEDKKRLQQFLYFIDVQHYYLSGDYKDPENRLMFSAMLSRSSEMAGVLQVVDYKINRDPNNKRTYDLLLLKAELDAVNKNIPLTLSDAKHKEYITKHLAVLQTRNAGFAARTKKLLFGLWQRIMPLSDTPTLKVSASHKRKEAGKLLIYKQIENPFLQQVLAQKSLEKLLQGQRPRILTIDQIAALNNLFPKGMLIDAAAFNRNYMTFLQLTEMPDLKTTFMDAQKLHNILLSDFKPLTVISDPVKKKITTLQQSIDNLIASPEPRLVQAIGNEIVREQKRLADALSQLEKWRAELELSHVDPNKIRALIGDKQFIAYQQLQSEIDRELTKLQGELDRLNLLSEQMTVLITKYLSANMSVAKPDIAAFPRHTAESPTLRRRIQDLPEQAEKPTEDKRVEIAVHN